MEDIHPDAGPLAYYPGSHKPELVPPFDWGKGSVVLEPDSSKSAADLAPYLHGELSRTGLSQQVFLPKKGDVLIWHGWLVHEGTVTRNPILTRKSYVTHYTSLGAYPEAHMYPEAFSKGRLTERNGGYVFDHPWVRDSRALPSWR